MSAKSGIVGAIYKQSAVTTTFTAEAATLQADNKTVLLTGKTHIGLVRNPSLIHVYKGGSEITQIASPYEIHFDRIIFREAQTSGTWTISGTYAELIAVGGAYEWSVDVKKSVQDITEFGNTWEQKINGLNGWSASAKRHYIDDDYISEIETGTSVIVRLFTDIDTYDSYLGYGILEGLKNADKVDGITDGEISFSGDGTLIWCTEALIDIP